MTIGATIVRTIGALWNVAGLIVAAIIVFEFGVSGARRVLRRLRHGASGKPDDRALADAYEGADWPHAYFAELSDYIRLEWAPFTHWRQRPYRGAYFNIDDRCFRATPGERDADAGAIRVFCFGASTMVGIGARDDATIPAIWQRRLAASGRRVSVTNCAQLAYNSSQEMIELQALLRRGDVPDVAVFYDGIADLAGAEWAGRAGAILSEEVRRAEFNLLREERRGDLHRAALVALMPRTLRRLRQWTGLALEGPLPLSSGVRLRADDIPELARAVIELYAANVRMVRAVAREYGFMALFFWQPVITTKKIKSRDEVKWEASLSVDVEMRRRLHAAAIEERRRHPDLARQPDVFDLSSLFDDYGPPLYIDLAHLSEPGNVAVAEAAFPAVAAAVAKAEARRAAYRS